MFSLCIYFLFICFPCSQILLSNPQPVFLTLLKIVSQKNSLLFYINLRCNVVNFLFLVCHSQQLVSVFLCYYFFFLFLVLVLVLCLFVFFIPSKQVFYYHHYEDKIQYQHHLQKQAY